MPKKAKRVRRNVSKKEIDSNGVARLTEALGYRLEVPYGERVPIALMFYDPDKKALEFARTPGSDLQEFIAIMRQILPDYGK